jgi:ATP-dependent Lhr-like helicase
VARGWHLVAVLERLVHLIGRPVQRVGLSATVGYPEALLGWLQGASRGHRPGHVVAPAAATSAPPAATSNWTTSTHSTTPLRSSPHFIAARSLVFCESRNCVEELGHLLRIAGVTTFLSHASLSTDERRQAEGDLILGVGQLGDRDPGGTH